MSVQVRRRREAASFLSTYVGAQGELIVDTTNNRLQVHDGATPGGWSAAKLAEVIVASRTPIADASYAALASDRVVAYTALTAARTVTLPAAAAYPVGTQLLVVDESGACSFASTITVARAGSDTIDGAASAVVSAPYGFLALASNGASKWTIVDLTGATTGQLSNRNAAIDGNFAINQRAYASGTALAAGAYAHDRWKAGASGCTYTFTQTVPDTTITITAGTLVQAVEAANVAATAWWLTWTGTATARVWQGSASGSFSAGIAMTIGAVAVSALPVTGLTAGTVANIEFSTGTLGLVQLEMALPNAGPTRFERRQPGQEMTLCQRYYAALTVPLLGFGIGGTTVARMSCALPCVMRAAPSLSVVSTIPGNFWTTSGATPVNITGAASNYSTTTGVQFDATASVSVPLGAQVATSLAGVLAASAEI